MSYHVLRDAIIILLIRFSANKKTIIHERINAMSVTVITKDNFDAEVTGSKLPVLLDFWAPWCGPCRMLSPVVDKLSDELDDVKVCKINVDEQPELASAFGVMSIPTLVVIKNGKATDSSVGVISREKIIDMLK